MRTAREKERRRSGKKGTRTDGRERRGRNEDARQKGMTDRTEEAWKESVTEKRNEGKNKGKNERKTEEEV